MAKVMVSLPDELLARLDRRAREEGTSRSGLLQRLAANHLAEDDRRHRRRIGELLSRPGRHGGDTAGAVRAARRSR